MQLPGSMLTFFPVMVLGRFTAAAALLLGNPLRRYPADLLFLWMDAQKRENHLAYFHSFGDMIISLAASRDITLPWRLLFVALTALLTSLISRGKA